MAESQTTLFYRVRDDDDDEDGWKTVRIVCIVWMIIRRDKDVRGNELLTLLFPPKNKKNKHKALPK